MAAAGAARAGAAPDSTTQGRRLTTEGRGPAVEKDAALPAGVLPTTHTEGLTEEVFSGNAAAL